MTFCEALDKLYMGMLIYWQVSRELAEIVGKAEMNAIVIRITHPNDDINPKIIVRIRRGKLETLDTFRNEYLYDTLSLGDSIEVCRKTNSPYVYIVR